MVKRHGKLPNTKINYGGVERSLSEWADLAGVPWDLVRMRYSRGKRNYADLFAKGREYTHADYDHTKAVNTYRERRKNIDKRVSVLEDKVEKLRSIVLQIAERVKDD
jgi:hypothetical protein